ncbi:MAG: ThuA domain-containing protein [Planctomycetota bacterium]
MRPVAVLAALAAALLLTAAATAQTENSPTTPDEVKPEMLAKIRAAVPDKAPANPARARKLLVYNDCKGFRHDAIPVGTAMLQILAEKTGAFAVTVSTDPAVFKADSLRQFDAVCFNNATGELFTDPELKQALLEFVRSGKGIVGIHAATDCFYNWPAFGELLGGYFAGHPWNETVTVKIDDPASPLNTPFGGQPFEIADEIYQFKSPYSRAVLHVLLSLDTSKTDMKKQGLGRPDNDYAVSWIRDYGKGRVFYCSLGHRHEVFATPAVVAHYLAGIQYALGDLPADATPSAKYRPSISPAPAKPAVSAAPEAAPPAAEDDGPPPEDK